MDVDRRESAEARWDTPEELLALALHCARWLARKGVPAETARDFALDGVAAALDPDGSERRFLRAWVFNVVRNRYVSWLRRAEDERIHGEPFLRCAGWQEVAVSECPSAEQDEQHARLHRALAQLPHEQQVLIRRHFFEDCTLSQIAAEEGVGWQAIQKRMLRARGTLGWLMARRDREVG